MQVKVIQLYPPWEQSIGSHITQESDCTSLDDIYNIPFVQRWMDDPTFHKLCKLTSKDGNHHMLVVHTNKGKQSWHIARLEGDLADCALPEWYK